MTQDFQGRGLSYPFGLGVSGMAEASGIAKVEQSMRIILGTGRGERVMRPDFGANLKRLAFSPNNDATANLARYYVTDSLTRWEPRIDVVDVTVRNDNVDAKLWIDITYRLRATRDVHNLIYPFYLEQR